MSDAEFGFVGRAMEQLSLSAGAARAAAGHPSVVIVSGIAGIGKTSLVRSTVSGLAGFSLVRAAADEFATAEPFATIDQLAVAGARSPFSAGLGLVAATAELQDAGPVVIVVEDAHWADVESRQALLIALDRFERGDRVLVVVTARPELFDLDADWRRLRDDPARAVHIPLSALSPEEVQQLAALEGTSLAAAAVSALHLQTGGHPLHVKALLRQLNVDHIEDGAELPAPRSLVASTHRAVATLTPAARAIVESLAVLGGSATLDLVSRVSGEDLSADAISLAVAAGLVDVDHGSGESTIRFAHPLLRTVVHDGLAPTRRRALHLDAARAASDHIAGLWHRVAAAERRDDELADDLERAAVDAFERGDHVLAGRLWVAAADLSGDAASGERRLLAAARLYLDAADLVAVRRLRDRLDASSPSPDRDLILGWLAWQSGDFTRSERLLASAATSTDLLLRSRALVLLGGVSALLGRGDAAIDAGTVALSHGVLVGLDELHGWATVARGIAQSRGGVAALESLLEHIPEPWDGPELHDPHLLRARAVMHMFAGQSVAAIRWFDETLRAASAGGLDDLLAHAHLMRSQVLQRVGALDRAMSDARRAIEVATHLRQPWVLSQAHAVIARVHGLLGDEESARSLLAVAREHAASVSSFEISVLLAYAEAAAADAAARPDARVDALAPLAQDGGRPLPMAENLQFWPLLIDGLLELERFDEAARHLVEFREAAVVRRLDVNVSLLTCDARLAVAAGNTDEALAMFARAASELTADTDVFARVMLHRSYGRLLRSTGRRTQAAEQRRHGLDLLRSTGLAWYRDDLRAEAESDLEARPARRSALDLTEREQDVAALVRQGLTNKEVAANLYVSAKAVEYHLGNIYGKLGIRSRRELAEVGG